MPDALDMLNNLRAFDPAATAVTTIVMNKEVAADLMAEQLAQGIRSNATQIKPDYKPLTIEIKETEGVGLGAITDRVTLYMHGDHYRQLYADVKGDEIEYGSRDWKSAKLEKKYGTKRGPIYGLTPDSRDTFKGVLSKDWRILVEKATGLKINS